MCSPGSKLLLNGRRNGYRNQLDTSKNSFQKSVCKLWGGFGRHAARDGGNLPVEILRERLVAAPG